MTKVLLVDDDVQVLEMMSESLAEEGFEVIRAENGKEAVERYREDPADVIVMDIIMPEQDGVEAIHNLRREFPDAKIIAISGGSPNIAGEYLLGTAEALGAIETFNKPVDISKLLQTIKDAV